MGCLRKGRMDSSEKMDPERLKRFVRHLCLISKKHRDREEARAELQRQIQRLKKFSSKKKEMDEELRELDRKISLVLEREAQLLGVQRGETAASGELMRGVMENKERIRQINDSISDVKEKLDNYIRVKTERERKINELEDKIRSKVRENKVVSSLKNRLNGLEVKYNQLKKKGVDVSRIEDKIQRLKLSFN